MSLSVCERKSRVEGRDVVGVFEGEVVKVRLAVNEAVEVNVLATV